MVIQIGFKDNVRTSFSLARKDVESVRSMHLRLQDSTHEWIIFLARENKMLNDRIAELEEKISQLESSQKPWNTLNR